MTERWRAELSKLQTLDPPTAPWEHPPVSRSLPAPETKGRRVLTIVIAFAIAAGAFVGVWVGFHPLGGLRPSPTSILPAGVPSLSDVESQLAIRGIRITPISSMPGGSLPRISAAQAMAAARSNLVDVAGFADARLSATLVSYTDAYLPFTDISAYHLDRSTLSQVGQGSAAWLVLSSPVRVSVLDPSAGGPGFTQSPANVAAFIDPSSGALVEVKTLFTGRAPDQDWPLMLHGVRPLVRLTDNALAARTSQFARASNPLRALMGGDISHLRVMRAALEERNLQIEFCDLAPKRTTSYCG